VELQISAVRNAISAPLSSQSLLRFRDFYQATSGVLLVLQGRNQRTPVTGVLVVRSITQPNAYSIRARIQGAQCSRHRDARLLMCQGREHLQETVPFPDVISETFHLVFLFWFPHDIRAGGQSCSDSTRIRGSRYLTVNWPSIQVTHTVHS